MWIKRYRCGNCKSSFNLGPGLLGFKLCPSVLICSQCNSRVKVSFVYRYSYYFYYIWKLIFFISFFISIPFFYGKNMPYEVMLFFWLGLSLFMGVFCGFLLTYFLAVPVALMDSLIAMLKSRKPRDTKKSEEEGYTLDLKP